MSTQDQKKKKAALTFEQIEAALEERSTTDRRDKKPAHDADADRRKNDRRKGRAKT